MKLLADESILWRGRPAWRAQLRHFVVWGLAALVPGAIGIALDFEVTLLVLVSLLALAIVGLVAYLRRVSTLYVVTNQRISVRRGIVSRKVDSASFERVQDFSLSQSVVQRMLGIGTVDFDTASGQQREEDFSFADIADPDAVVHQVSQYLLGERAAAARHGEGL